VRFFDRAKIRLCLMCRTVRFAFPPTRPVRVVQSDYDEERFDEGIDLQRAVIGKACDAVGSRSIDLKSFCLPSFDAANNLLNIVERRAGRRESQRKSHGELRSSLHVKSRGDPSFTPLHTARSRLVCAALSRRGAVSSFRAIAFSSLSIRV